MPGQLTLGFREQMNQITSFADSSNVYGSDLCEMRELREFHGGRLNSTKQFHGGRELLPLTTENAECKARSGFCFEAGDARNSEQPLLAAMHTAFMRYHNQASCLTPRTDTKDHASYDIHKIPFGTIHK